MMIYNVVVDTPIDREETPVDGGQEDEQLKSLASTKKHLKVNILFLQCLHWI